MALSALRQLFEPQGTARGSVVIADRLTVQLNPEVVTTDTYEFEETLMKARQAAAPVERLLNSAVEMYHGPFLRDYYEDWVLREQKRLADLFFQAIRQLISIHRERNAVKGALEYAQRLVALHPEYEEAHQELIRAYAAAGQRTAARLCYQDLERRLFETVGREPSPDTRDLLESLQAKPLTDFSPIHRTAPAGEMAQQCDPALPAGAALRTEIKNAAADLAAAEEAFLAALNRYRMLVRRELCME